MAENALPQGGVAEHQSELPAAPKGAQRPHKARVPRWPRSHRGPAPPARPARRPPRRVRGRRRREPEEAGAGHTQGRCLETAPRHLPLSWQPLAHGLRSQRLNASRLGFRNCHYFTGAVSQPTLERKSLTPPKGWTLREEKSGPRLTSLPTHVTSF